MARDSAEKEIDEAAGKFSRPRTDIAHLELLACADRANKMSATRPRQSANFDRGGNCRPAEPARTSGLSERDCSHLIPPLRRTSCDRLYISKFNERWRPPTESIVLDEAENQSFFGFQIGSAHPFRKSVVFQ